MDVTLAIEYFLFAIILAFLENVYLLLAPEIGIIDKPNSRSSHKSITIRGGGIIFWFAALAYYLYSGGDHSFFFAGITIIAVTSFIDDLRHLNQVPRFFGHLAGFSAVFIDVGISTHWSWLIIIAASILFIGILNAYNFMDGINGITGLYSISILTALQFVNIKVIGFAEPDFLWFPMIASAVFLIFNFRKKALCFAGDVGSMTIAFWIIYLLLLLMLKTHSVIWILFSSLYGVDSVLTILHRLWLRQNIFEAHRLHFYQILANELKIDHRAVSTGYALTQGLISAFIIWKWESSSLILISAIVLIPLTVIYTLKFKVSN